MSREAKTPAENDRGSCASLAAQCLIRPRLTRPRLANDKAAIILGLLPQKAVPTWNPDAEIPAPPETPTSRERDRQFESPSLQRRVMQTIDSSATEPAGSGRTGPGRELDRAVAAR